MNTMQAFEALLPGFMRDRADMMGWSSAIVFERTSIMDSGVAGASMRCTECRDSELGRVIDELLNTAARYYRARGCTHVVVPSERQCPICQIPVEGEKCGRCGT